MFIEPNLRGERRGWIEVICGSMFSGKTEELIRRLKRVKIANLKVEIFKPAIDTRYDEIKIVSHDTNAIHSTPVESSQTILLLAKDVMWLVLMKPNFLMTELQCLRRTCIEWHHGLLLPGWIWIIMGNPFGQMPNLLAIADYITKLHAICVKCGNIANISYRKVAWKRAGVVGEKDIYEPRCRHCAQEKD